MIVVTAGSAYLDIDAYAGCIAFAELLRLQGFEAIAASTSPPNSSITKSVQNPAVNLKSYTPIDGDSFVLIDVTNREYLDTFVVEEKVIEVIDHHPGHEDFWRSKLGEKAQIEPIGAACTLVYERWEKAGLLDQMQPINAKMLAAGILDNTLNFTAAITKSRDHEAYEKLSQKAELDKNFPAVYFSDAQKLIEANLADAVKNDVKLITETNALPQALGQIVTWDAKELLSFGKDQIAEIMKSYSKDWAVNIVSISEGKTYFMANELGSQA
ncbi:MAG: hypothetical protein JWO47_900, partial [Candidatus Saccharibacteria bacterium]|nr:hypothetical protein [Candidatus Saccharibacteria bacterium]